MTRTYLLAVACLLALLLIGCGGSQEAAGPVPPGDGDNAALQQVGPLLVRPASAAGFVAQEIPNPSGPISFVALHGSRITYLASQALLDRIVFSRGTGSDFDIWVCNLDGSGAVRLLDNAFTDSRPVWSPDGQRIAFDRQPSGQDAEIIVMGANGTGPQALTSNIDFDGHPAWSPRGDRIAFATNRDTNYEIYRMYADGSWEENLTNNAAYDDMPTWSPAAENPSIVFVSNRDVNIDLYRMGPQGESPTRFINNVRSELWPDFSPAGDRVVYTQQELSATYDVYLTAVGGLSVPVPFEEEAADDAQPAWSTDGRFICYASDSDGAADWELWLRETAEPFRRYRVTTNAVHDTHPDLGSPTLQTDRVIIGPNGSDWGGTNPIWSSSDAGIAAWAADGYRNFVRIGVPANQLNTLSVTPLAATAQFNGIGSHGAPLGVVVEAADIINLREDGGRGAPTLLWQLDPLDATAVLLYFDGYTGKLLSVLVLRDQNYPAGAGAPAGAVTERSEGGATVVEGAFAAVFDGTGARIADAASEVRVGGDAVSVVR